MPTSSSSCRSQYSAIHSLQQLLPSTEHMLWQQVGDGSMQCVSAVPSLKALVLGYTRVQDTGLAMLATLPGLTHLAFAAEGITHTGLLVSQHPTHTPQLGSPSVQLAWQCMLASDPQLCTPQPDLFSLQLIYSPPPPPSALPASSGLRS